MPKIFAILTVFALFLSGCYQFNNPVDPKAADYQGFPSDPDGSGDLTPAAADGVTAVADPADPEHGAIVSWTDNADNEDGFVIERQENGNGIFTQISASPVGADVTLVNDATLSGDSTYTYRITAYNAAGNADPSATATVSTAPNAPSVLAAVGGALLILLTWTDNSAVETGFFVDRSADGSSWSGYLTPADLGPDTTNFYDSGLTVGSSYYYRVRAVGAGGASTYSNTANATVLAVDADTPFP